MAVARWQSRALDVDPDSIGGGQRPAEARVAVVVGRHRKGVRSGEVDVAVVEHIVGGSQRGVDLTECSGQRHRRAAAAGHGRPAVRGHAQRPVGDRQRGREYA
jgi:hypothetical protein